MKSILLYYLLLAHISCMTPERNNEETGRVEMQMTDTVPPRLRKPMVNEKAALQKDKVVNTVKGKDLVGYARTLMGVPYKYASALPSVGFDCSGFITYVFNHFEVEVPRSSIGFTNIGQEVDTTVAREGDLILFTGTNEAIRLVGHMGIVTENSDSLRFIHSTSGKANGVTVTALNKHYQRRFVKVIRVLAE